MPLASSVMDMASAVLNDKAKTLYSYTEQIPYLNIAIKELIEELQKRNIAVTNEVSAMIPLTAVETTITPPADLIEIRSIYEADPGLNNYLPVGKVLFLPKSWTPSASKTYWAYEGGQIKTLASVGAREFKIDYIGSVQAPITDETDPINIVNSENFLGFRTGALCAEFISQNFTRADKLNIYANSCLDRLVGIGVKSEQGKATRRRPFNFGRKRNG